MDLYQSLVTVNPVTLIAQICNLFIQLFLAKTFFLDKVKAILDQRREAADKEIADAKDEISGLAMAIAGKVVERELNSADQEQLIDRFINELGE